MKPAFHDLFQNILSWLFDIRISALSAMRAAANEIARVVKLADNTENMNLGRIPNPTEKDFARMEEYEKVREILLGHGSA